jgi:bifunctional non-homologous end joining protein LigD
MIAPVPWDTVKEFAHQLVAAMAADAPDCYVATAAKRKRNDRIFIDYLRNNREATMVAPYSTRAPPCAPVSTPIAWDELGALKSAHQYSLRNLAARLKRLSMDPCGPPSAASSNACPLQPANACELMTLPIQIVRNRDRCYQSKNPPQISVI